MSARGAHQRSSVGEVRAAVDQRARSHSGQWGLGCEVCSQALGQSTHLSRTDMATFKRAASRVDVPKKHQATAQRQKSSTQALEVDPGPKGLPLLGAPPLDVVAEALAQRARGGWARVAQATG